MKIISIKKSKKIIQNYFESSILSVDCGEQALPYGGVCNLGSINLTQFINEDENDWDYYKLSQYTQNIVRFMDNINDIANVPLEHQKKSLLEKRRLGIGIMGYASSLLIMNYKYGSVDALKITEKLEIFLANSLYAASALLAKEKGAFKLFDAEKYLQSEYIKVLNSDTIKLIKENGIRNSHIRTIPPTGNTAVIANNVSSGLEPIFSLEYERYFIIPEAPAGLDLPKHIDWNNKTYESDSKWKWISEGNDNLLTITFDNNSYKFDSNRGLTKKAFVRDYGYEYILNNNKKINKENIVTIADLDINAHVETMKVFAKYIDSSISKTINLPNNFPFDEFKNLYLKLYQSGIKGGTSYRAGTMMSVLSEITTEETNLRGNTTLIKTHAPKRPKKLKCDIHHITAKGQEWVVLVGMMNGGDNPLTPYEVFAFKKTSINIGPKITTGYLTKVKSGCYNLELDSITLNDITTLFIQDEEEALTRMISISLRHGVDVSYIVEQLNKSEGTILSFSKAIVRALKKYISDETEVKGEVCPVCSGKLIYAEGCKKCSECDWSKC